MKEHDCIFERKNAKTFFRSESASHVARRGYTPNAHTFRKETFPFLALSNDMLASQRSFVLIKTEVFGSKIHGEVREKHPAAMANMCEAIHEAPTVIAELPRITMRLQSQDDTDNTREWQRK